MSRFLMLTAGLVALMMLTGCCCLGGGGCGGGGACGPCGAYYGGPSYGGGGCPGGACGVGAANGYPAVGAAYSSTTTAMLAPSAPVATAAYPVTGYQVAGAGYPVMQTAAVSGPLEALPTY